MGLTRRAEPFDSEECLRVLYAFDPWRVAILLIGGDKTGDPGWYDRFVPVADALFPGTHRSAIYQWRARTYPLKIGFLG